MKLSYRVRRPLTSSADFLALSHLCLHQASRHLRQDHQDLRVVGSPSSTGVNNGNCSRFSCWCHGSLVDHPRQQPATPRFTPNHAASQFAIVSRMEIQVSAMVSPRAPYIANTLSLTPAVIWCESSRMTASGWSIRDIQSLATNVRNPPSLYRLALGVWYHDTAPVTGEA